jgi:hypothetical protein
MLYNLDWLVEGGTFPPPGETARIRNYIASEQYFNSEHWSSRLGSLYYEYAQRINRISGKTVDIISFPVLLNYQRLLALKTADLVCGEYPLITGKNPTDNETLKTFREDLDFDTKAFATVIDLCRYGDCVWRMYKDSASKDAFTVWDIKDWYPIVSQDGTLTILKHVLAWIETLGSIGSESYRLHVQIHSDGEYETRVYELSPVAVQKVGVTLGDVLVQTDATAIRSIGRLVGKPILSTKTGYEGNAVIHIRNMAVSNTIYGYDDYIPIDSLIAELMTRMAQVSKILDKHADPSMTGPAGLAKVDKETGERYFEAGDYYGSNPGDTEIKYLTWEGQLEAGFKQIEILTQQLYILTEMGSALLGAGGAESGQAISGTAMRFKLANPLAKARRISNLLTLPARSLFSICTKIDKKDIAIVWQDGLPDDPKETMDMLKVATGQTQMMPLKVGIEEILKRTPEEADLWIAEIEKNKQTEMERTIALGQSKITEPDGSYKKTGSPQKNSSSTGLNKPNRKSIDGSEDK